MSFASPELLLGLLIVPLALIATVPFVLVVNNDLPAKSVSEFIALAKSKPGQLNFSSPGVGSANHLAGELLKTLAGIHAVHVPYKGIPEALAAVIAGEAVDLIADIPPAAEVVDRMVKEESALLAGSNRYRVA